MSLNNKIDEILDRAERKAERKAKRNGHHGGRSSPGRDAPPDGQKTPRRRRAAAGPDPSPTDDYPGDHVWDEIPPNGTTPTFERGDADEGRARPNGTVPIAAAEAEDDPHRLGRVCLDVRRAAGRPAVYWCDEWHVWRDGAYRPLPDREMRAEVTSAVKAELDRCAAATLTAWRLSAAQEPDNAAKNKPLSRKVTTRLVADVLQAMAGLALLPYGRSPPYWIDGPEPFPAAEALAFRDAVVHLPALAEGRAIPSPATPRLFTPTALDFDFAAGALSPRRWLAFLRALWEGDGESVAALQEWFGYCLLPDTRQQKILMVVGPRRSGKGTVARVLTRLVGRPNVAAPTLASLGTPFGLSPLLGKSVAIISDARLSGRTDTAVVTERLLSVSGEDAQTIDRKHRPALTVTLPTRFVILTNELPRLSDVSGAFVGRLLVLRLTRSFYGCEDTGLTEALLGELPGILLWAAEGWRRLRDRGRFAQPATGAALVEDMEDLASPIGAFVREVCDVGPGHQVVVADLFSRWRRWCEDKGRRDAGTEQTFGRDLRAALPQMDQRRPRSDEGRVRVYEGLRLKPGEEPIPDIPFGG